MKKPLPLAIGTCLIGALSGYVIADTRQNPFSMTELPCGYMVAGYECVSGIYKEGSAHDGS